MIIREMIIFGLGIIIGAIVATAYWLKKGVKR